MSPETKKHGGKLPLTRNFVSTIQTTETPFSEKWVNKLLLPSVKKINKKWDTFLLSLP